MAVILARCHKQPEHKSRTAAEPLLARRRFALRRISTATVGSGYFYAHQLATARGTNSVSHLEGELDGQLHLARVAYALAQEAIKVEQRHRGQRVDQIVVIE